jgi:putative DNA methylase
MTWDFAEGNPLSSATAGWDDAYEPPARLIESLSTVGLPQGTATVASATAHPLPDDASQCLVTDPPYYNAVPYADLSDFFYVWLRRAIGHQHPELFQGPLTPKDDEICEMAGWDPLRYPGKSGSWFEARMGQAMAEGRRVVVPGGIGVVVFAHKSTSGWEAQLQAMLDAY